MDIPSPDRLSSVVIFGQTLRDYRSVTVDVCNLSVTIANVRNGNLQTFKDLLKAEGIDHVRLRKDHPMVKSTIRLVDGNDLRKLICKMGGRVRQVIND